MVVVWVVVLVVVAVAVAVVVVLEAVVVVVGGVISTHAYISFPLSPGRDSTSFDSWAHGWSRQRRWSYHLPANCSHERVLWRGQLTKFS